MKVNRIFIEWENEGGPSFWVLTTSWTLCPINVRYPFPVWIKIRQLFYFRHFCVYSNCFFVKHKNSFSTNCSFNYENTNHFLAYHWSCDTKTRTVISTVRRSVRRSVRLVRRILTLLIQSHLKSFGSRLFQEWSSLTSRHCKYKQRLLPFLTTKNSILRFFVKNEMPKMRDFNQ